MGRKAPPQGAVFPKKEEKVSSVLGAMADKGDAQEFKDKFKQMYPEDWQRIIKRYNALERNASGSGQPMPEPEKYLLNTYKVGLNKYNSDK